MTGNPSFAAAASNSATIRRRRLHPGDDRDAGLLHRPPRPDLVADELEGGGRRADEDDLLPLEPPGEIRVLGEEAVAGMDGLGARPPDGLDDAVHVEIALRGRRGPDEDRLVGEADVEGGAVRLGIDGDARDAHLPAGPDDADGDLAAVRDQDLAEHVIPPISASAARGRRPCPPGPRRSPGVRRSSPPCTPSPPRRAFPGPRGGAPSLWPGPPARTKEAKR